MSRIDLLISSDNTPRGGGFKALTLGVLMLLCALPVYAQEESCQNEINQANTFYARGGFDETIAILDVCLAKEGISDTDRSTAYRLKGLSYIGKGLEVNAQTSVERLIELFPNYEPDPVQDPPDFIEMVNRAKEELNELQDEQPAAAAPEVETPVAANTPPPANTNDGTEVRRKKGGAGKWILGGLGLAAAGGAVFLLTSDSGGGGADSIAEPPALP